MDLPKELRKWITAVIKQRSYLVSQGLSRKNNYKMAENAEYLRQRLDYFPFDTDRKISLLFQQNRQRILTLLPGEGSGGYEKRMEEFHHFDRVTLRILQGSKNLTRAVAFPPYHGQGSVLTGVPLTQ